MAEQAFAISPVSASGTLPTEADFASISEAFMETARGRWFLQEYARRNRNADTEMVLDAVTRIERSLTAQKDPDANKLPDLIAAMRDIAAATRASAEAALAQPAIEDALAPARKCARVIKEIAWGLRESGADSRICNLLDMQVSAIGVACDDFSATGIRSGVIAAFEDAERSIAELENNGTGVAATVKPSADIVNIARAQPARTQAPVAVAKAAPAPISQAPSVQTSSVPAPGVARVEAPPVDVAKATPPPTAAAVTDASLNASLGASLIANGVVKKSATLRGDPLAPLRRMSSAERVAFFS